MNSRIGAGALLVILGIVAGAWFHRGNQTVRVPAGEASVPNAGDPNPSDAPTPLAEGALPSPKIPDRLPQFSLHDPAGKVTPIASFGDKSLMINFWATWCAPCRSEIPLLQSLHAEWAGRGMSVVGIAVDQRDKDLKFARRFNIGYPLLIGEQDALGAA